MKRLFRSRPRVATALSVGVALPLYLVGLKFLLVPVLLACMVMYLPFPRLFRSVLSRVAVSGLLLFSLLLVTMMVQYLAFPNSRFGTQAVLISLLTVGVVGLVARFKTPDERTVWFDIKDRAALIVVALFAVPFALGTGLLSGSAIDIARFGGVQSSDGANHFAILMESAQVERLDYPPTSAFYPKGFHFDLAFVLDSLHVNPAESRWGINVRVYMAQFLVVCSLAAYLLFYLARLFANLLSDKKHYVSNMWLAITIGLPVSLLYLLPFTVQGFVNYAYAIAIVAAGLVYVYAAFYENGALDMAARRLYLVAYLLLIFGISMSWTLLMPPLVLIPLLILTPAVITRQVVRTTLSKAFARKNWPVIAAVALQTTPLFLQFKHATLGSEEWLNASGGIRAFHVAMLGAGLVLVLYYILNTRFTERARQFMASVFLPLYIFMLGLMVMQYFLAGELRYYTIKSAYLVELLLILVAAIFFIHLFVRTSIGWLQSRLLPIILLLFSSMLLIGLAENPLRYVREMFRNESKFGYPAYYDTDVRDVVGLHSGGRATSDNVIILHYDKLSHKMTGNLMVSHWAAVLEADKSGPEGRICIAAVYRLAIYQDASKEQQEMLREKVLECAEIARKQKRQFYIVTDRASVPYLRHAFGDSVKLVY